MNKNFLLIFYLIISFSFLHSQSEIKRTLFVPPKFYIGDPVELRIQIELDEELILEIPQGDLMREWVEIREIQISQNGKNAEILINFTSFSPGTRSLPPLDFKGFLLPDFKIYTNSFIEEGASDLRGLRHQVMIPGSRLYFFLIALGFFLFPYLSYFLIKFITKSFLTLLKKYHAVRPFKSLSKVLNRLESNIDGILVKDFFISLSDSLRVYLTVKTGFDCKSATTSEISRLSSFEKDKNSWEQLVTILRKGDLVKFGGEEISRDQMREYLQFVQDYCHGLEKRDD